MLFETLAMFYCIVHNESKGLHIIYWGYGTGNIAYGAATFVVKVRIRGNNFFSKRIRGKDFLTETESSSGGS